MFKDKKDKRVKKITAQYLERAAAYYLSRFSSSSENLRRILERKVWRRVSLGAEKPDEVDQWIDDVLAKFQRMELLDDQQYAMVRAKNFQSKGRSLSRIKAELNHKGIASEIVQQTLEKINPDGDADFEAALRLVRKKKLGNFATKTPTGKIEIAKLRQKHLAILARAGFSFDIAKNALDSNDDFND